MDHLVRIAHHATAKGSGRILTIGLGSCVAITLYEPLSKVGGMAHVLLPDPSVARDNQNLAKFATTAVPLLLSEMRARGMRATPFARLAGGASLFGNLLGSAQGQMGTRNVAAARAALREAGIGVRAEETGGEGGRSVVLEVESGRFIVRSMRGGEREL